jgi:hypothetical protein
MKILLASIARLRISIALGLILQITSLSTGAETVAVKNRGMVNLERFDCEWVNDSSLIQRICYQTTTNYLLLNVAGTYVHYCRIAPGIVIGLRQNPEKERYFNQYIRARYECHAGGVPVG